MVRFAGSPSTPEAATPGLNAVIRAVVLGAGPGLGGLRHPPGVRRAVGGRWGHAPRPEPCGASPTWGAPSWAPPTGATRFECPVDAARRAPSRRRTAPTRSCAALQDYGFDALIAIGGDGSLTIARRPGQEGPQGGGGAQDHRQRPGRHPGDVRLPHRRADRHRRHRQAPLHGRVPPTGHGGRAHGAATPAGSPCSPASPARPT